MTIIVARQRLQLGRNGSTSTARFSLDPTTQSIALRIKRQTTGSLITFGDASRITTRIAVRVDAQDFVALGQCTGGVRAGRTAELDEYVIRYALPWGFFGDRSGGARRLGEGRATFDVLLEMLLQGDPIDTQWAVDSFESAAPLTLFHSSAAFDLATDASEVAGDGIVSLTHTASGTNRAAFACNANSGGTPRSSSSVTYAAATMTELWDTIQSSMGSAGCYLAGPATGAQTVTGTLSGTPDDHRLAVITMTGVNQTTPVGTPQTSAGSGAASATVTVTSVGADDLVVDSIDIAHSVDPAQAVGADQIERTTELAGTFARLSTSTQLGSLGGVMSYTFVGSTFGFVLGAVAFKAAPSGVSRPLPQFPNRGPLRQNYGPRVLGFKQGLAAAAASIDIASAGVLVITATGSLTAIGTLNAAAALVITGAGSLTATGTLTAAGVLVITGTAALTSTGTLASAGTAVIVGAATLTAQGTLAVAGTLVINGAAALTGIGSLASAGTLVINGAANLTAASANDMASAGSIVITSSAELSAVGSLASSGFLTITGVARLDDGAVVVTAEQNAGGWPIFAMHYEQELSRRRRERQRQLEIEDDAEQIPEEVSREIAALLHEQEAKTARRQELERLRDLAATLGAEEAERQLGQRVAAALTRAVERGNYSALEALDREIKRATDDEEAWLLAITMILSDD